MTMTSNMLKEKQDRRKNDVNMSRMTCPPRDVSFNFTFYFECFLTEEMDLNVCTCNFTAWLEIRETCFLLSLEENVTRALDNFRNRFFFLTFNWMLLNILQP